MFFEKKDDLFIGRFGDLFGHRTVFHGFSTRKGGVSRFPYDTLNLGRETGDVKNRTEENRRRFFRASSISADRIAIPQQVHGDKIVKVTEPGNYLSTDGIVTDRRGLALIVQVADCLPVYFYDPCRGAVGLVHAGWRGTRLQISSKAVLAMGRHFGTEPQDLCVFFGPSIGPCCYEVGQDVASHFSKRYVSDGRLDLWQCNRDQLVDVGVQYDRVVMSRLCTGCHPEWFFSHRLSGGQTGRMMAIIGLLKKGLDI